MDVDLLRFLMRAQEPSPCPDCPAWPRFRWLRQALGLGVLAVAVLAGPSLALAAQVADLTWTDHADNEDGFRIYKRIGPTGAESLLATVGPNVTTATDPGPLSDTTQYCYRVAAFNAVGEAARVAGDEGCAITLGVPAGATGVNVNIRVQ